MVFIQLFTFAFRSLFTVLVDAANYAAARASVSIGAKTFLHKSRGWRIVSALWWWFNIQCALYDWNYVFISRFKNRRGPPTIISRSQAFSRRPKTVVRTHILTVIDLNGSRTTIFRNIFSFWFFLNCIRVGIPSMVVQMKSSWKENSYRSKIRFQLLIANNSLDVLICP